MCGRNHVYYNYRSYIPSGLAEVCIGSGIVQWNCNLFLNILKSLLRQAAKIIFDSGTGNSVAPCNDQAIIGAIGGACGALV
jgi:hypothetical protein